MTAIPGAMTVDAATTRHPKDVAIAAGPLVGAGGAEAHPVAEATLRADDDHILR